MQEDKRRIDYGIQVFVVGDAGVGKTSLVKAYCLNQSLDAPDDPDLRISNFLI